MLLRLLEQELMRLFPGLLEFTEDLITQGQEQKQSFFSVFS